MDDLDDFIENSLKDVFTSYNQEMESFEKTIWDKIELKVNKIVELKNQ